MSCSLAITRENGEFILSSSRVVFIKDSPNGCLVQTVLSTAPFSCEESFATVNGQINFVVFEVDGEQYAVNPIFATAGPSKGGKAAIRTTMQSWVTDEDFSLIRLRFLDCVGGGTGSLVEDLLFSNNALTLQTDLANFSVDIGPDDLTTVVPLTIGGTLYPAGTSVTVIDQAFANAMSVVSFVDNGDDTFTFTGPDGSPITIGPFTSPSILTELPQGDVTVDATGNSLSFVDLNELLFGSNLITFEVDGQTATFDGTNGFQFAADYSSSWSDRSIVDKEYVDRIALKRTFELIVDGTVRVKARYIGITPTVTISGLNKERVQVFYPVDCIIERLDIHGTDEDTLAGVKFIEIIGPGLAFNDSTQTISPPVVQKVLGSSSIPGAPSPANPYFVDIDNNPIVNIIGVGTGGINRIEIRVSGLNQEIHLLNLLL